LYKRHTMINQFMKMGGCKTKEEFYSKFPTEQSFFEAFPQAQQYVKQYKDGGQNDAQMADQQAVNQQAAAQQQMINQYIQAYADMNGMTLKEVMRELQRLPENQQKQALQEIIATVNQAVAQQQQAASTGDMAMQQQMAAEQQAAAPGEMPMDPSQAMQAAYGGSKLNKFIRKTGGDIAFPQAAPMYDDSIYRTFPPNMPRLFANGGSTNDLQKFQAVTQTQSAQVDSSTTPDPNNPGYNLRGQQLAGGNLPTVEVTERSPWGRFFGIGAAGTVGYGLYLGRNLIDPKLWQNLPLDVQESLKLSSEYDKLQEIAKNEKTTVDELLKRRMIIDPSTGATIDTKQLKLNQLTIGVANGENTQKKFFAKLPERGSGARLQMQFPGLAAESVRNAASEFSAENAKLKEAEEAINKARKEALRQAELIKKSTTNLFNGPQGINKLSNQLYNQFLKTRGLNAKTIDPIVKETLTKTAQDLATRGAFISQQDAKLGRKFITAVGEYGSKLEWGTPDQFKSSLAAVSEQWQSTPAVKRFFLNNPRVGSTLKGIGTGAILAGLPAIGAYLDKKFGWGQDDETNTTTATPNTVTTTTPANLDPNANTVVSQGSAPMDTLPRNLNASNEYGQPLDWRLDTNDPNNPMYVSGDSLFYTPEGLGYEEGTYVVPKQYGGPANYGAFTVPYLMTGGSSAMPGIVMTDQVIDNNQKTLKNFIDSYKTLPINRYGGGNSSKKKS